MRPYRLNLDVLYDLPQTQFDYLTWHLEIDKLGDYVFCDTYTFGTVPAQDTVITEVYYYGRLVETFSRFVVPGKINEQLRIYITDETELGMLCIAAMSH